MEQYVNMADVNSSTDRELSGQPDTMVDLIELSFSPTRDFVPIPTRSWPDRISAAPITGSCISWTATRA
jgi:hypothetical protein